MTRLEDAIAAAVAYSSEGGGFSPGGLASALQAYTKAFPDSPRSQGLRDRSPRPASLGRDRRVGPADGRVEGRRRVGRAPGGQRPRRPVPAISRPVSRLARVRPRDHLPACHGGDVAPRRRRRRVAGQAPEVDDRPPGPQPLDDQPPAAGIESAPALLPDAAARPRRQVGPLPRRVRRQGAEPHPGRATGSTGPRCRRRPSWRTGSSRCCSRNRPGSTGRP